MGFQVILLHFALHDIHDTILTLTIAIFAGGMLTILARRIHVPTIVLLLLGGFALGPEVLGLVVPDALHGMLPVIVSLAIGVILFEGGMTLDLKGYRRAAKVIPRLLSVGVLVTWLGTALLVWLIFRFEFSVCLLAGSLVVVTGPTVVQPLLKRIRLRRTLHNILHWEGVMIDPIGVFLAIFCFDYVMGAQADMGLIFFVVRFAVGILAGYLGGELLCLLLRKKWVPDDAVNLFTLCGAIMIFGIAEGFIKESGLLSVTVAGLVLGWRKPAEFKAILEFKTTIVDLLIGMLFILLTARLEMANFYSFGWKGLLLVMLLIVLIRPLAVFASSVGTNLGTRDRIFLSWVAPRGIVAASMSSLFALSLLESGRFEDNTVPLMLESFVYTTIVLTIMLQGFSAAPLAVLLKLQQPQPNGWLIVGAHPLARQTARFLIQYADVPVALVDGNRRHVAEAKAAALKAFVHDARDVRGLEGRSELNGVGHLLALTDNEDLNELLCDKWGGVFGKDKVYRWASGRSLAQVEGQVTHGRTIWSGMPAPSFICGELLHGESVVTVHKNAEGALPEGSIPLIAMDSKKIVIDPEPGKGVQPLLLLQREVDFLLGALRPGLVWRMEAMDKEGLLKDMCERFAKIDARLSADQLFKDIMERERNYPTVIGQGVALPHCTAVGITEPLCAVAQLSSPVCFAEAKTGDEVQLVFMLISPPDMPQKHLAVLGEIARLLSDADARDQIMNAESPSHLLEFIREHRLHTLLNKKQKSEKVPAK